MTTLVIDDSRLARNELKRLLKDLPKISVIGEASNAPDAKDQIERERPDLIFLDIQMPGKNGFELLEDLEFIPQVIFTTAYDEFALKAFEVNALDYLQKPIEMELLIAAVDRVNNKSLRKKHIDYNYLSLDDQVFVKDGERCWFVPLKDIRLFEVDGNYTKIYFQRYKPMIPRTLNYLESRLDPRQFFRANRQQMINLQMVERIEPWFSDSVRIYLQGGHKVDVSRRQTQRFKELMST